MNIVLPNIIHEKNNDTIPIESAIGPEISKDIFNDACKKAD